MVGNFEPIESEKAVLQDSFFKSLIRLKRPSLQHSLGTLTMFIIMFNLLKINNKTQFVQNQNGGVYEPK